MYRPCDRNQCEFSSVITSAESNADFLLWLRHRTIPIYIFSVIISAEFSTDFLLWLNIRSFQHGFSSVIRSAESSADFFCC
jgi:hypothetical protein